MTNNSTDPRNDPNMLRIPFIFVKHGDPPPVQWMAEHPDYLKVPAVMVPHGSPPPWPWGGAGARPPAAALEAAPAREARFPGSFVPPAPRQRRMPGGQAWPKDGNGRDWPKDRWGRPMRPLWDYPPGVRAPGEGVAPGAPGSIGVADAIGTYRRMAAVFAPSAASTAPTLSTGADSVQDMTHDPGQKPDRTALPGDASSPTAKATADHDTANQWNPQAGSDYLNDPRNGWTGASSKWACAVAVRVALEKAGVDTRGHPY